MKHELVELKALVKTKKIQEELQSENEKLHKEITALKKELNADKTDKVKEQQKEHSNKKQDIIVAGDSMLNNIEDRFNLILRKQMLVFGPFQAQLLRTLKIMLHPSQERNQMR